MRVELTRAQAVQRAATIRRQNVQRHERVAANSRLRDEILRKQYNANRTTELHSLQEAAIRGNGLDQMALSRINELQRMVR
jgi:hypothetical protein